MSTRVRAIRDAEVPADEYGKAHFVLTHSAHERVPYTSEGGVYALAWCTWSLMVHEKAGSTF